MKNSSRKLRPSSLVCILLLAHTILVSFCCIRYSFAYTEAGLLPAGIIDWKYSRFDVFRVNPPLVRLWATWPLYIANIEVPFEGVSLDPRRRAEWEVASTFTDLHGKASLTYLALARLMCLPISILGGWMVYKWASEVYGKMSGIGALFLWTFNPTMIGFGCLISGDVQATTMGVLAIYLFRKWLKEPDLSNTVVLGIITGAAILTKSTWLVLVILLPILWALYRFLEQLNKSSIKQLAVEAIKIALVFCIALAVINATYGFSESFHSLGSFEFISRSLGANNDTTWAENDFTGNRFRGTMLGGLPVPLPKEMIVGIDLQKWDFDRERWSYLDGDWRQSGWWYYYLYGFVLKAPVAWAILAILAIQVRACRHVSIQEQILLLGPVVFVLVLASCETGVNKHLRYVMPIFPFLFIYSSRVFSNMRSNSTVLKWIIAVLCSWYVTSSVWIYPHSMSYFNELVGGPLNGPKHLNSSNVHWGQDLSYLSRWCEENPHARPLFVIKSMGIVKAIDLGIPAISERSELGVGFYAVDQEMLFERNGRMSKFLNKSPIARAGYGFNIYWFDPEEK